MVDERTDEDIVAELKGTTKTLMLKYARIHLLSIGLWVTNSTGIKKYLYKTYSYFIICIAVVFPITEMIDVVQALMIRDIFGAIKNLEFSLLFTCGSFKVMLFRNTKLQNIIKSIQEYEINLFESGDKENIKMYKDYIWLSYWTSIFLMYLAHLTAALYFFFPLVWLFDGKMEKATALNITYERPLIHPSYVPFDSQKHWWITYVFEFIGSVCGYTTNLFSDAFFLSVLVYLIYHCKHLQYCIIHMNYFSRTFSKKMNVSLDEARFQVFFRIVAKHRAVIQVTEDFDSVLSNFMLLDFLVASLRLASLILNFLSGEEITIVIFLADVLYVFLLSNQIFILYWIADILLVESSDRLAEAIFHSDWTEYPISIKKLMIMMLVRTSKPCTVSIGPFYVIRLQAALMVAKTTYGYLALLTTILRKNRTKILK